MCLFSCLYQSNKDLSSAPSSAKLVVAPRMGCLPSFPSIGPRSFSLSAVELSWILLAATARIFLVHSSFLPSLSLHKHLRIYITMPFVFPMLYHLKMPSSCRYPCSFVRSFVRSFIHYESHTHPPPSYLPSSRMRIIIVIILILCLVVLLALAARSFPIQNPFFFLPTEDSPPAPQAVSHPIIHPEAAICPQSSTQFSTSPDGKSLNRAGCGHSPRS